MTPTAGTVPPPISWAQRNDLLYVIIDVECKDIENNVTENSFTFKGVNALDDNIKYEVTLNFLNSVDPQKVTCNNIGRCIEYTIYKKESGPFWKSLTNDKTKLHFLKANFIKWQNESDDEGENDKEMILDDVVSRAGTDKSLHDFLIDDDFNDDDSDDNIPSLSQNDDDDDDKKDEEKKDQEK